MKNGLRLFALLLIGVFAISFVLAINGNAAGDVKTTSTSSTGSSGNGASPFFTNLQFFAQGAINSLKITISAFVDAGAQVIFIKLMFALLLSLIIYSAINFMPIFGGGRPVRILVSIVISALAIFWLDNSLIITLLTTYQAMGVALTSVVPFLIILAFNYRLYTIFPAAYYFFGRAIWILFGLFLLFVWFSYAFGGAPLVGGLG